MAVNIVLALAKAGRKEHAICYTRRHLPFHHATAARWQYLIGTMAPYACVVSRPPMNSINSWMTRGTR